MPRPGFSGSAMRPPAIRSGRCVSRWPSCQIQCVSMAVIGAGRRGRDVREHRQRHVEVIVRVRAPGQAPVAAQSAPRAPIPASSRSADRRAGCRPTAAGSRGPARASRSRSCWSPSASPSRAGTPPSPRGPSIRSPRRTGPRRRRARRAGRGTAGSLPQATRRRSGSSVMRACGKRLESAVTASISASPAITPPLSLKSSKP